MYFSFDELANVVLSKGVSVMNAGKKKKKKEVDYSSDEAFLSSLSEEQRNEMDAWYQSHPEFASGNSFRVGREAHQVPMPDGAEPAVPATYGRVTDPDDPDSSDYSRDAWEYGKDSGDWDDDDLGDNWDGRGVRNARRKKLLNMRRAIKNRRASWKRYTSR